MYSSHLARLLVSLLAAVVCCGWGWAAAETITLNVDPGGTTQNRNIYGTTVTSNSATWSARGNFRDYQFELLTNSGSATFDGFRVQLSASRKNNTPTGNRLWATLWSGPMVANPQLADALTSVSIADSNVSATAYQSVMLTGSGFNAQAITSTPSVFFFRIWAEGDGSVNGFATKMAATLNEFQAITMADAGTLDGRIGIDTNDDGTIDGGTNGGYDPIQEVPEPSTLMLLGSGVGLLAAACRRRRSGSP